MKRIFLTGLLVLGIAPALLRAADITYYVGSDFFSPPSIAPTVDATNFIVNANFSISSIGLNAFKTHDTLNFTNFQSGTMTAPSGFDLELWPTLGAGPKTASTFYNGGVINAGTKLIVTATNIASPGSIFMTEASQINLTGSSVDLSGSTLGINLLGTDGFALLDEGIGKCPLSNTVAYAWDPSVELTPISATSSIFTNIARQQLRLGLLGSTPYFTSTFINPTNQIINAVFLENDNPNVGTRVFINPDDSGDGRSYIEWAGSQIDPASGNTISNFIYLSDVLFDTTNAIGFPDGYSYFEQFGTPLNVGTAVASAMPTYNPGPVTNTYAYINLDVAAGSADTNTIFNGSITNLPGRIVISGSKDLDLAKVNISAPNYLRLESTNQFKGNDSSFIAATYGDIRLGSTNGFMTISNLWTPNLPRWNGPIVAWNTRWFNVITNGAIVGTNVVALTNDYRVLLVFSSLNPFAPTYVQDLSLHATNTLILCDTFRIMRSLLIDARSLTISTNGTGAGVGAVDGELDILSANLSWSNSVPNLRWLTNNGAIRISSISPQNFGSGVVGSTYLDFINTGFFADNGTAIHANEFLNSGMMNNGGGSFLLNSLDTTVTAGQIIAGGDMAMSGQNLIISNSFLSAKSLTLTFTNLATDITVTNGNFWSVGNTNGTTGVGFALMRKPVTGDLLGTSLTNYVGSGNKQAFNTWAGQDRGATVAGYTNNMALGRLILDTSGGLSTFNFSAVPGMTNALYVDYLELRNAATNRDGSGNFPHLILTNNLTIYYAQAVIDGFSIAEKMNGKNTNHLIWVPSYTGFFSSTNIVAGGVTNAYNAALAQSTDIDSDGDGTYNVHDTTPVFLPSDINLLISVTNIPPHNYSRLTFNTIPHATNFVYFSTDMVNWSPLTNFLSPDPYPSPATNVVVVDPTPIGLVMRYYQVQENTWLTFPF